MDWFRSYVGTSTDPKFRVVAKKSGARLGDVLAVWQMLLERACSADERGRVDGFDCESVDALLDLDEGQGCAIYAAMEAKGLVVNGHIAAWEKRQPKRERDDDSSFRVRAYRERKKQESNDACDNVTPCNATQRQETPRGEEIRGEESKEKYTIAHPTRSERDFEIFWQAYPRKKSKGQAQKTWDKLRKGNALPDMPVILDAIAAAKAGQDWQRDGGKFIPHPGTWLNAMGWEDENTSDVGVSDKFAGAL